MSLRMRVRSLKSILNTLHVLLQQKDHRALPTDRKTQGERKPRLPCAAVLNETFLNPLTRALPLRSTNEILYSDELSLKLNDVWSLNRIPAL